MSFFRRTPKPSSTPVTPAPARAPPSAPVRAPNTPPSNNKVFDDVAKSLEYAQSMMAKTQTSLAKAQADKEGRNKVISKASDIVNALLDPALQVANLLDGLGGFFPPCKVTSNTLQTIVGIEQNRRENDVRIVVVIVDIAGSALFATLGSLKPGFEKVSTLIGPLGKIMTRIDALMKEFEHLLHSTSNKSAIANFREQIVGFKADLTHILSQQSVLILADNTKTLARIEAKLAPVARFYAMLSTGDEAEAETFVHENGGEDAVKEDDELLEAFAEKMGEALTPSLVQIIKESTEAAIRQSQATFMLKFQFQLEMKLEESQEDIMKEVIWKGMAYYFNRQFKAYRASHNRGDQRDAWTRNIINKVSYHSGKSLPSCDYTICDAIDDDASGYISVGEVIEFMHGKPEHWSVPDWAYGWDADNLEYAQLINQILGQLYLIRDNAENPNAERVQAYLDAIEKELTSITRSVYNLNTLDPTLAPKMDRLREEWCQSVEGTIKRRLKTVNYRFDDSSFMAIVGTQRVESNFYPFAYLLLARHLAFFQKPNASVEDTEEAVRVMKVLLSVADARIHELKAIWRRQRIDVEVQVRYYANGLFEDYYKNFLHDDLDRAPQNVAAEWDEDDGWRSDEGEEFDPAGDGEAPGEDPAEVGGQGEQDGDQGEQQGYREAEGEGAQGYGENQEDDGHEQQQEDYEGDGDQQEQQQQHQWYGQRYVNNDDNSFDDQQGDDEQYARDQARGNGRGGYDRSGDDDEQGDGEWYPRGQAIRGGRGGYSRDEDYDE
ncbi:hypothetical protein K488DRAFT_71494 [Vararia minispora EC-137]|uniref:Uncharacterized protein n=1 Tax=Vararia minispora EC-137 TaxID=1314806 RepID=A0ACB8QI92_9AGAM|nr:hypothetical protein K488DRAFT_71494 [Vararia minispora EC-137]